MARRFTRVLTTPAASRIPRGGHRPFVSLLSDWSERDPSAAICRGVILGIAPDALIVDISHQVDKFNIRHGALQLWSALPYLPIGAHMAVVDPGVGTARRAIAIETARGDFLVGPDNGLLLPAAERLGGVTACHLLENPQYHLPVVSATFHGRDLFAPAAAHLALGVPVAQFGPPVEPAELVALDWPAVAVTARGLETAVIYEDSFGNLKLAGLGSDLVSAVEGLEPGQHLMLRIADGDPVRTLRLPWARTFGEVGEGEPLLFEDSYGRLSIARNGGSAADALELHEGSRLTISRSAERRARGLQTSG
jgi:S-adenosylmethionine hydrolase